MMATKMLGDGVTVVPFTLMPGNEVPQGRRLAGAILRFPLVLFLGLFWVCYLWIPINLFAIAMSVVVLVLAPLAYPVLYALTWLKLAFSNSGAPVLPDYWKNYPSGFVEWCRSCLILGFATLRRWFLEGF